MVYGYLRVSTDKQDEGRQEEALKVYDIDHYFLDKISGKRTTDRPEFLKMLLAVKKGDRIITESISRLGRNVVDLRNVVEQVVEKGAVVHFVREGLTTEGTTYKFLLTILGAVAEMERENINQNVKQGIEKAKLYGTKSGRPIGRPKAELPKKWDQYYLKYKKGELKALEMARLLNVSRTTFYRYIKRHRELKKID